MNDFNGVYNVMIRLRGKGRNAASLEVPNVRFKDGVNVEEVHFGFAPFPGTAVGFEVGFVASGLFSENFGTGDELVFFPGNLHVVIECQ